VAVGCGLLHQLAGDDALSARLVFHDHGLAERLAQPAGDEPRDRVGTAAGAEGDDNAQRPLRESARDIGLRERLGAAPRHENCRKHRHKPGHIITSVRFGLRIVRCTRALRD
jgi:hypothetical protein